VPENGSRAACQAHVGTAEHAKETIRAPRPQIANETNSITQRFSKKPLFFEGFDLFRQLSLIAFVHIKPKHKLQAESLPSHPIQSLPRNLALSANVT
jgi:hypothetical protein